MQLRPFGRTGLHVPLLGFGAMQIGDPRIAEDDAAQMLNSVLDAGLTLIDTARSYGLAEERIGRHLAHRRSEFTLSTKVGYGVPDVPDWTYDCIVQGVDAARNRLRTETIDVVHLHSCGLDTLLAGEVTDALSWCVDAGKVRVAAFSGDDEALAHAVDSGAFGSVQASVNVCDQQALPVLRRARAHGAGTIAKRSLAGRPWSAAVAPDDPVHREYQRRFQALRRHFGIEPDDWDALALRFAAYEDGVDCVIVGGSNVQHMQRNLAAVAAGPLEPGLRAALRDAFMTAGADWRGLV
jgi:aryl-alcohol dehydrogenase-like predicted oxidoreductase